MLKQLSPALTALSVFALLTYSSIADESPYPASVTNPGQPLQGADPRPFSHPDRIKYDSQCFTIDGKDVFLFSGSFHYFRCPKELWPARFQAIKDAGFNTLEVYESWNYHEPDMPASTSDMSKVVKLNELDDWLTMAEKYGFYVIARPGPYICSEWSNGGLPRWLTTLKKPGGTTDKFWARSDDPTLLAWEKHWLDVVCPIIAKHQITKKPPGSGGVILFQIENEYDYVKGEPNDMKVNVLSALAKDAQDDGIDVPLLTCFTSQTRGAKNGPLRAVFDCTNFYPGVKIEKALGPDLKKQRAQQPDAPLATTELQAGWFAQVGGHLSDQQPGLTAQQIQNLTLFAWQLGDTMTNYYMVFGGTNFDDWAGGMNITSYDYNAPVREDGGVSERYQRVWALGHMLQEHGSKLVRALGVDLKATTTDKDVEVAERKATDGSRYIFVRTENQKDARAGHADVTEQDGTKLAFDYNLEPFGSMVLYLAPGVTDATKGEWLPKPAPGMQKPSNLPAPVVITQESSPDDSQPLKWEPLKASAPPESVGIYGSHYFYYKLTPKGGPVVLNIQKHDGVVATVDGNLVIGKADRSGTNVTFDVPQGAKEMVVLYENMGHANFGPELGQPFGILGVQGADMPTEIAKGTTAGTEEEFGDALTRNPAGDQKSAAMRTTPKMPSSLLTWHAMNFALPEKSAAPWHVHIEATGNGFIYINGHCLGRYWQAGPQHDFFLPEPLLHLGGNNSLAIDLRPTDKGEGLQAVSVAPDAGFAVETAASGN
jgi:hypothetical protein